MTLSDNLKKAAVEGAKNAIPRTEETLQEAVRKYAFDSLEQKEIKGNQGFQDSVFDAEMRRYSDFQDGYPWCICHSQYCWNKAFEKFKVDPSIVKSFNKLCTAGVTRSWRHFTGSKEWITSTVPKEGAIAFFQMYKDGKPQTEGHAGITDAFNYKFLNLFEGNTDSEGGREGIEVAEKKRRKDFHVENGLRLLGFLYLPIV